jgi:hypothetical protein
MSAVPLKAEVKSVYWHLLRWGRLWVDAVARQVIQAPKPEPRIIMRYELTDHEWGASNRCCRTSRAACLG